MKKRNILRPSAAFKNQGRWQNLEKDLKKNVNLGPGSYLFSKEPVKKSASLVKK